jgi:hypothetical protein
MFREGVCCADNPGAQVEDKGASIRITALKAYRVGGMTCREQRRSCCCKPSPKAHPRTSPPSPAPAWVGHEPTRKTRHRHFLPFVGKSAESTMTPV